MRYWGRSSLTGSEADQQLRDWDRFVRRVSLATSAVDLVVGPVVADVAPEKRPMKGEDYVFALPWSLTGWPAVSVPAGADPATGLPFAVQIAGKRWNDLHVLRAPQWVQEAFSG
jgi:Asp-tRNA(Asn)/Glu-tRNA(Gln) amidotransferase A subunit family amidase